MRGARISTERGSRDGIAGRLRKRRTTAPVRARADLARDLDAARERLLTEVVSAEERGRLTFGADVHDGPLQLLLAAVQDLDDVDDPDARRAQALVRRAARELRELLTALAPDEAPGGGAARLRDWCTVLAARGGFAWELKIDDRLGDVDRLALSIVRELVTNAAKHACCRTLHVELLQQGPQLVITVRDDGVGIPAGGAGPVDGYGLSAMRRRVEAARGTMHLASTPGRGTLCVVVLPLGALRASDTNVPEAVGALR